MRGKRIPPSEMRLKMKKIPALKTQEKNAKV